MKGAWTSASAMGVRFQLPNSANDGVYRAALEVAGFSWWLERKQVGKSRIWGDYLDCHEHRPDPYVSGEVVQVFVEFRASIYQDGKLEPNPDEAMRSLTDLARLYTIELETRKLDHYVSATITHGFSMWSYNPVQGTAQFLVAA